jgi:glutathione S-transferase
VATQETLTLQLYYSPTSPYVRKITVLIHEAGLDNRVERIAASGTPLDPGSLPVQENPLGKVPVLVTPHGTLYDSRVICRYLDDLAGAGAYPAGDALWRTLVLESTADGILDASLLMVYEGRLRPESLRFQPWIEAQWAKVSRALDVLEADWQDHLGTPKAGCPDMGHIALGAALGYVDFRLGARDWRAGRPALAAWAAQFMARPSMAATVPQG